MTSLLLTEAREAPGRITAMLAADEASYAQLVLALDAEPPDFAATVARGSSDHAASYLASLLGIVCGLATASIPPSLVTRYASPPRLERALVLGLSQSGASPDLLRSMEAARDGGAITVGIVNAEGSPLAGIVDHLLPQRAGPERSVAASKSFIATLAVAARLVAHWRGDGALRDALALLPERLEQALRCDWAAALPIMLAARSLYVVGRGPGLAIAQEAALKLKETSALHAEALSAAELEHGPKAIIGPGFPLLVFALDDAGGEDSRRAAERFAAEGATVMMAGALPAAGALMLPLPPPLHPLLDPIVAIAAFYPFAEQLARAKGRDPDNPPGLRKVTQTF